MTSGEEGRTMGRGRGERKKRKGGRDGKEGIVPWMLEHRRLGHSLQVPKQNNLLPLTKRL